MIFTIGYEGLDTARFMAELKSSNVRVLVDVRDMPLSRKKGFSKNALAATVEAAGMEYRHIKVLGAPREIRYRMKETGDWGEYCQGYSAHLESCEDALLELLQLSSTEAICLMCFEADYRECHRSLITRRLEERGGAKAIHLGRPTSRVDVRAASD